jgi:hypothetical protein
MAQATVGEAPHLGAGLNRVLRYCPDPATTLDELADLICSDEPMSVLSVRATVEQLDAGLRNTRVPIAERLAIAKFVDGWLLPLLTFSWPAVERLQTIADQITQTAALGLLRRHSTNPQALIGIMQDSADREFAARVASQVLDTKFALLLYDDLRAIADEARKFARSRPSTAGD